jgi:hypothetical protein
VIEPVKMIGNGIAPNRAVFLELPKRIEKPAEQVV